MRVPKNPGLTRNPRTAFSVLWIFHSLWQQTHFSNEAKFRQIAMCDNFRRLLLCLLLRGLPFPKFMHIISACHLMNLQQVWGEVNFLKGLHLLSRKRDLNRKFDFCWLESRFTSCWVPPLLFMIDKSIWSGSLSTTCPTWCKSCDNPQRCPCAASKLQLLKNFVHETSPFEKKIQVNSRVCNGYKTRNEREKEPLPGHHYF